MLEDFSIRTGLRQGDSLFLALFNFTLVSTSKTIILENIGLNTSEGRQVTILLMTQ